MYGFLLNMWVMKKVDEQRLISYTPKFLSEEERKAILATAQNA
ncbi:hypothetical protein [Paenibacillus sp. 23TSA30-6]|nr:hypothetical protein [Paenibacillus sp. 23TSA30-6]